LIGCKLDEKLEPIEILRISYFTSNFNAFTGRVGARSQFVYSLRGLEELGVHENPY
jgi:hypothetical protein